MLRHLLVFGAVAVALAAATEPAPAVVVTAAPGRANDTQPHFGGAKIDGPCTSGFSVRRNGTRITASVVAGHCFPKRDDGVSSGPEPYGEVKVALWDTTRDMSLVSSFETIPETYSSTIYVDPPGLPSTRRVVGARDPLPTDSLCVSGSITGNQCGLTFDPGTKARSCNQGSLPPLICTENLDVARKLSGGTVAQKGDSGAPVYARPSDGGEGVIIVGMLVGVDPNNASLIGFEPISFIQQQLDVTVLVTAP